MKKIWTKYLVVLCAFVCMLSMTACGKKEQSDRISYDNATKELLEEQYNEIKSYYEQNGYDLETSYGIANLDDFITYNVESIVAELETTYITADKEELEAMVEEDEEEYASQKTYLEATDGVGEYKENSICDVNVSCDEESQVYTGTFKFEKRDVMFTYTVDVEGNETTVVFEKDLTLTEILKKAGMNTLLGMGTVFLVLILISCVIGSLGLFSNTDNKSESKEAVAESTVSEASATVQPTAPAAPLPDEVEMAIVLATAIAAAEEETGSDGYRVRSVKRVKNSKWRRS